MICQGISFRYPSVRCTRQSETNLHLLAFALLLNGLDAVFDALTAKYVSPCLWRREFLQAWRLTSPSQCTLSVRLLSISPPRSPASARSDPLAYRCWRHPGVLRTPGTSSARIIPNICVLEMEANLLHTSVLLLLALQLLASSDETCEF